MHIGKVHYAYNNRWHVGSCIAAYAKFFSVHISCPYLYWYENGQLFFFIRAQHFPLLLTPFLVWNGVLTTQRLSSVWSQPKWRYLENLWKISAGCQSRRYSWEYGMVYLIISSLYLSLTAAFRISYFNYWTVFNCNVVYWVHCIKIQLLHILHSHRNMMNECKSDWFIWALLRCAYSLAAAVLMLGWMKHDWVFGKTWLSPS